MAAVEGKACLAWIDGAGKETARKVVRYHAEVPSLPQAPSVEAARALAAIQLVCANLTHYAVPPRTVYVWTRHPDGLSRSAGHARWRKGVGYCHGAGILKVAPPPSGAEFKVTGEEEVQA